MGRTTGIQPTKDGGYKVDKVYRGQRIQQYGFCSVEEAESWLVRVLDEMRRQFVHGVRSPRTFDQAAAHYLKTHQDNRWQLSRGPLSYPMIDL